MATHFSILAWRMPWTEEPNGLQSMGLQSQTRLSNFHLLTHTDNLASYLQLQVPGLFKKSFGGCFKNVDFFFSREYKGQRGRYTSQQNTTKKSQFCLVGYYCQQSRA